MASVGSDKNTGASLEVYLELDKGPPWVLWSMEKQFQADDEPPHGSALKIPLWLSYTLSGPPNPG